MEKYDPQYYGDTVLHSTPHLPKLRSHRPVHSALLEREGAV